ncbi:MAG TPA: hypothetical protein ENN25_00945 [Euryarchaeota archaeon]|nr:hypothetical protein [Euryarchaeota archaeon]
MWKYYLVEFPPGFGGLYLKPIEEQLKKEIKERKLADVELAQVKNRLEYLLINNPAVIYTSRVKDDWSATFISKNIKKQLGYNPKDFLEDSTFWISHIHPDDRERVKKDIMKIFETDVYDHGSDAKPESPNEIILCWLFFG